MSLSDFSILICGVLLNAMAQLALKAATRVSGPLIAGDAGVVRIRRGDQAFVAVDTPAVDWTSVATDHDADTIVLAGDGDVGGLIGIHCRRELNITNPIVSIDGLELREFDYVDIGALVRTSGAVTVVIKSLVFPAAG